MSLLPAASIFYYKIKTITMEKVFGNVSKQWNGGKKSLGNVNKQCTGVR
jgi:hypothetical protein